MKKRGSYSFLHMGGNLYHILDHYSNALWCVLSYPGVVRVDKHRTTLMTKQTTNVDAFTKRKWETAEDGTIDDWWVEMTGPHGSHVDSRMNEVLNDIAEHQERHIAKLITE